MDEYAAGLSVAIVTVSDSVSRREAEDRSGPEAARILETAGASVVRREVVPDERAEIVALLRILVNADVNVIITTGGTGVAPRDVTPEATAEVCDRLIPGLAELMRRVSLRQTPFASLSRAVAGVASRSVIVNLPGSPGGVHDCLEAVLPVLSHASSLIRAEVRTH